MILQVNKDTKDVETKERCEDYIEISSVREMKGFIVAQSNKTQIYLSFDKKFKTGVEDILEYSYDNYNRDNQDFLIDSVYLLDDTGKTIKKLM